jgi:hypothetical protein
MSKENTFTIKVWLENSGAVIVHENAVGYQKGDLYCVFETEYGVVYKYPVAHIWRTEEGYPESMRRHPVKENES